MPALSLYMVSLFFRWRCDNIVRMSHRPRCRTGERREVGDHMSKRTFGVLFFSFTVTPGSTHRQSLKLR